HGAQRDGFPGTPDGTCPCARIAGVPVFDGIRGFTRLLFADPERHRDERHAVSDTGDRLASRAARDHLGALRSRLSYRDAVGTRTGRNHRTRKQRRPRQRGWPQRLSSLEHAIRRLAFGPLSAISRSFGTIGRSFRTTFSDFAFCAL